MKFKFTADIVFEADDMFEAFDLLRSHFDNLSVDEPDENGPWFLGQMELKPEEVGDDGHRY